MRRILYILLTSACALPPYSCTVSGPDESPEFTYGSGDMTGIDVSCVMNPSVVKEQGAGTPTKSIIGQSGNVSFEGNFIRLHETRNDAWTPADYTPEYGDDNPFSWDNPSTVIVNAVMSAPDNTSYGGDAINFRSVRFSPRQTYQYGTFENDDLSDAVGYITRMVGWYPSTFSVPEVDGEYADQVFDETTGKYTDAEGRVYVRFDHKLDGRTDVMVSDMREGRIDKSSTGFRNNDADYPVQPFGHQFRDPLDPSGGYEHINYFTFNHYLTAIRLFIKADESAYDMLSWRTINDIVFVDQPHTLMVELPVEQAMGTGLGIVEGTSATLPVEGVPPVFGTNTLWEGRTGFSIERGNIVENDFAMDSLNLASELPVTLHQGASLDKAYLGYALVKPGEDVPVELHTDVGVFSVSLPHVIGDDEIFLPGYIYNIVLNIDAEGMDVVIDNEDDMSFLNLSPYNPVINDYEYSNCYVITPELMRNPSEEGVEGEDGYYDGYYFNAMVPGNGKRGYWAGSSFYPSGQELDPESVKILWQTDQSLITHAELVHGHVRFVINEDCIPGGTSGRNRKEGSAVLAVYDGNSNILWSWHIWITSQLKDIDYGSLNYVLDGVSSSADVCMMNMNLGAKAASWSGASDVLDTYGFYYQWGRKDPSPGPMSYDYSTVDMRTVQYYYLDEGTRNTVEVSQDATIENSVQNPLSLIQTSGVSPIYPNDWLSATDDRLWGWTSGTVRKTIYDPCPYGYRVPSDELQALFYQVKNDIGGTWWLTNEPDESCQDLGYVIELNSTLNYFPYTGWKGRDRGFTDKTYSWFKVGQAGDYQDARISKTSGEMMNHRGRVLITDEAFSLTIAGDIEREYEDGLTQDYANRSSASPVRCVKYDNGVDEEPARQ